MYTTSYIPFNAETIQVSHNGIVLPFEFVLNIYKNANRKIDLIKDLRSIVQSKSNGVFSLSLSSAKSIVEYFMFNMVSIDNIETMKKGGIYNSHSSFNIPYEMIVSNSKIFIVFEIKLDILSNYSTVYSAYKKMILDAHGIVENSDRTLQCNKKLFVEKLLADDTKISSVIEVLNMDSDFREVYILALTLLKNEEMRNILTTLFTDVETLWVNAYGNTVEIIDNESETKIGILLRL